MLENQRSLASPVAAPMEDECKGKSDGFYIIADVFRYLECKSGAATFHSCPDNQIYIANMKKCGNVVIGDEGKALHQFFDFIS